ncbi:MAG TPA: pitrilysin family protein [Candidatus Paceibacterota bacterium]
MAKHALKKVRTVYGISEYHLDNGLRVLYKQDKSSPVVAACITYHVGSRNEAKGHTGATHILEHLMFKDSKHFNKKNGKSPTNYLDLLGSRSNASTWTDRTNYYELLPKENLEEALALEADRMRNAGFTKEDLASEMTVVRNEYEQSRNNPFNLLDEAMTEAAFTVHPYRISTIGTKEDIEHSTVEKLREFYDTYYYPNNATLSLIGDISWKEAEKLILKHFGPLERSAHVIPTMDVTEPEQTKARLVSMKKPLGVQVVMTGYKTPAATHPDFPAVILLGTILGDGFASRLRRALIDTGLAADMDVTTHAFHDPFLLVATAHVTDTTKPERVLSTIRKEIARLTKIAPTKQEIAQATETIMSQSARTRDGVLRETQALVESIAAGDWTLMYRTEEEVKKLKPADLLRAARTYLKPTKETTGILYNAK